MTKIYTGLGDDGYTKTLNNPHILKSDPLIELLGTIDEFCAALGVAKAFTSRKRLIDDIESVQKKLIPIMGEISGGKVFITSAEIKNAEVMCDSYCDNPVVDFILPGRNITSAHLHMARTIIRRAERVAVRLLEQKGISKPVYVYINRLSDLIYAMSCYAQMVCDCNEIK